MRDPKTLQIHLAHERPLMTMRYLATLTAEDALQIQQEVKFYDLFLISEKEEALLGEILCCQIHGI